MKTSFHNSELPKRRLRILEKKVTSYTNKLAKLGKKNDYTQHESSLFIAGDTKYQRTLVKALLPYKRVKQVILVGIGGSSLGAEAVYRALAYKTGPTLTVLDSVDRESIGALELLLKRIDTPSDVVLVVVSKSGSTTETMMNAVKVLEVCEKKFDARFRKQVVFIGDADTAFIKIGKKMKVLCLAIPNAIGGRYSVFTAAGLVPLMLLGIDVQSLREGALDAVSKKELKQRAQSALTLALHAEAGVHTVNFFTFNKRLEVMGYWYRQLLAESIGKKMTTKGTTFSHQLLPVVSTSVDLHSMAQLYLGGYKNIFTHFIYYNEHQPFHVLTAHWLLEHVPFLAGKTFDEVNDAIVHGVRRAYTDQNLTYQYTELSKCTAYEVGFLLSSLMCETMYLGHLLNVDPFDQPSVELYKKHTRKALGT